MDISQRGGEPLLLTIPQAAARLGVSRAVLYRLIGQHRIVAITVGARKRVPVAALQRFIVEQMEIEMAAGKPA